MLSPSTARIDGSAKLNRSADAGIPQYWIVDTDIPFVTVHDPVDGSSVATVTAHGSDVLEVSHPLGERVSPSALV